MHPRLNWLVYTGCGHITFWTGQIFSVWTWQFSKARADTTEHFYTRNVKLYISINPSLGKLLVHALFNTLEGVNRALERPVTSLQCSGVLEVWSKYTLSYLLILVSNCWDNCLNWPQTMFLKGQLPPGSHSSSVICNRTLQASMYTLVRSQILHVLLMLAVDWDIVGFPPLRNRKLLDIKKTFTYLHIQH